MNEAINLTEVCVILWGIAFEFVGSNNLLDFKTFEFCISSEFKSVPCRGGKQSRKGRDMAEDGRGGDKKKKVRMCGNSNASFMIPPAWLLRDQVFQFLQHSPWGHVKSPLQLLSFNRKFGVL